MLVSSVYGNDEPILRSTAPLGGDHTRTTETVIALVGRVIPEATLKLSASCLVSRGMTGKVQYGAPLPSSPPP